MARAADYKRVSTNVAVAWEQFDARWYRLRLDDPIRELLRKPRATLQRGLQVRMKDLLAFHEYNCEMRCALGRAIDNDDDSYRQLETVCEQISGFLASMRMIEEAMGFSDAS